MESKKEEAAFEKTKQALGVLGLIPQEIDTYFKMTGRGTVTKGEICIIQNIEFEEADKIVNNLLSKGLLREVPGKTPHYVALPPYSALLGQISQFKTLISDMQVKTPKDLENRFMTFESQTMKVSKLEEYQKYLKQLRAELPQNISKQLNSLQSSLEEVKKLQEFHELMDALKDQVMSQLGSLKSGLEEVKKLQEFDEFMNKLKGSVSTELNAQFIQFKERLENIKVKIAQVFEKQFRISALKSFAEKIVSKIISEEFGFIQEFFEEKFVNNIEKTLDQVLERILSVADIAGDIGSSVEGTFEKITENVEKTLKERLFSVVDVASEISSSVEGTFGEITTNLEDTLKETESKLSDVRSDILGTFDELKNVFKDEIFETLQSDILKRIFQQLELSEKTMQEFWDRARRASLLSFQDVWFIRSAEAMQAQINDSVSRAKMRVHIISPKLHDIDFIPLKKLPRHVNIRISTWVDPSTDRELYEDVASHGNISIRNYTRQNIWAINKDFEEVVVCVISASPGLDTYEIAGMGSILDEHIKMFAGVLEEVWMNSEKITHKIPSMREAEEIKTLEPKPSLKVESISAPVKPIKTKPAQTTPTPGISKPSLKPAPEPEAELPSGDVEKIQLISSKDTSEFISRNFNLVKSKINTSAGFIIGEALDEIRESLLERMGFSMAFHKIASWARDLKKINTLLPENMKQELSDKIIDWINKLIEKT